jgi:four helix bundle protein
MTSEELKGRTQEFALRIIRLVGALPRNVTGQVIGRQVLRSGTSVGANYRAACRARSRADFVAKLAIAEEEADETLYWLELLVKSTIVKPERLLPLVKEANELVAIITSARKTTQARGLKSQIQNHKSQILQRREV